MRGHQNIAVFEELFGFFFQVHPVEADRQVVDHADEDIAVADWRKVMVVKFKAKPLDHVVRNPPPACQQS